MTLRWYGARYCTECKEQSDMKPTKGQPLMAALCTSVVGYSLFVCDKGCCHIDIHVAVSSLASRYDGAVLSRIWNCPSPSRPSWPTDGTTMPSWSTRNYRSPSRNVDERGRTESRSSGGWGAGVMIRRVGPRGRWQFCVRPRWRRSVCVRFRSNRRQLHVVCGVCFHTKRLKNTFRTKRERIDHTAADNHRVMFHWTSEQVIV